MDIRFCDLCNESVPASDFAKGLAFMRKDKVICTTCERAMGGGAEYGVSTAGRQDGRTGGKHLKAGSSAAQAQPGPPSLPYAVSELEGPSPHEKSSWAGAAALFVATGALAAAGTGGLMLAERLDGVEQSVQANGSASVVALDQMRRERTGLLGPLEGKIDDAVKSAGVAASGARLETSAQVDVLHSRLATAEARSTELRSVLDATRQKLEDARAEARAAIDERDSEIASLQKIVQFHGDSLVELRERIREAGALVASGQIQTVQPGAGIPGAGGAGFAGGGQPAGTAPKGSWGALLPDLGNPDEALRLNTVLELVETKDPAVAEYILPMLKDSDSFVRMVSAQGLGDLGYKPAVPHLIDGLADKRWTVREAARDALRTVTGKNFGFDPTARELEMKKRIDQWRGWWRREGDDFLTNS
ncbi:MAG: hypothetical protein ACI8WY_003559 [Planctomycetota bacterium]|jgi:hypothetical protein